MTPSTGTRISEETGRDVDRKQSGSLGGDVQIAAEVAEDRLDGVVFLCDPYRTATRARHRCLLRICDVHDTPLATTRSAAEYLLDGLAADFEE